MQTAFNEHTLTHTLHTHISSAVAETGRTSSKFVELFFDVIHLAPTFKDKEAN